MLNREQFEARIDVALATCRDRPRSTHMLCHLDIDHFALINDALGPAAGNRLLSELAATMASRIGPGDAVGRTGDSSFGLIFDGSDVTQARRCTEEIVAAIAAAGFAWQRRSFDVSASAGLVVISSRSPPAVELLRQAGLACLQAKQEGRGQIVVDEPGQQPSLPVRQLTIGSSIREAMSAGRISLAGQDIVCVRDAAAPSRYFELLLRLNDRQGRVTPAGDLVAAAERFDLMRSIDRWVLEEALDRLGDRIAALPGLSISVNLSGSSIGDARFLSYLLETIARSPIEPTALTFELTETEVMRHAGAARRTIDALRELGCRIALDDFGVGLSNFDYLQRFPVDIVKIDGRFVRHMLTRPRDAAIVEAIVSLARRLGAKTVVEHVETAELMARVTALGADFAQGYHVGRPRRFTTVLEELALAKAARYPANPRLRRAGSLFGRAPLDSPGLRL
ncbi:MAG: EAL domain-containing protein [Sphingomonadaceae bacterium]|nr:EAL domain-containing protein [Sphingomonadaceae bacterium]